LTLSVPTHCDVLSAVAGTSETVRGLSYIQIMHTQKARLYKMQCCWFQLFSKGDGNRTMMCCPSIAITLAPWKPPLHNVYEDTEGQLDLLSTRGSEVEDALAQLLLVLTTLTPKDRKNFNVLSTEDMKQRSRYRRESSSYAEEAPLFNSHTQNQNVKCASVKSTQEAQSWYFADYDLQDTETEDDIGEQMCSKFYLNFVCSKFCLIFV
jgi:hypothetical protein